MLAKPTVALTLGDPAGIGPELIAKLLARRDVIERAKVVLVGDAWLWEEGQAIAGVTVATRTIHSFDQVGSLPEGSPFFLPVESARKGEIPRSTSSAAAGASVLKVLSMCLDAAAAGQIDAICFAPLNKYSMKLAGMQFPDELHFFADYLKVSSHLGEFNSLGNLWTARISSHVPLKDVALYVTRERILDVVKLLYDALRMAGFEHPRVAVAGLNPHAGEGRLLRAGGDRHHRPRGERGQCAGISRGGAVPGRHHFSESPRRSIRWRRHHVSRPGADRGEAPGI